MGPSPLSSEVAAIAFEDSGELFEAFPELQATAPTIARPANAFSQSG
jgi:hypothetical protein